MGVDGAGQGEASNVRFPCPCCRFLTLTSFSFYEICQVCGWEDTGQGDSDADDYSGGPNRLSLSEARRNFLEFGAAESRKRDRVRPPMPGEVPPTVL